MSRVWNNAGIYLVLTGFALFYLMPFYVLFVTGLKPFKDVSVQSMWDLPDRLYFGSYAVAWTRVAPNFWSSVQITVAAAFISSLIGSLNGYIFAKWRFRCSNVIFTFVLFGIFLPYQGILIPLVLTLKRIGLYGTIPGVVLAHCVFGIPITALIFAPILPAFRRNCWTPPRWTAPGSSASTGGSCCRSPCRRSPSC